MAWDQPEEMLQVIARVIERHLALKPDAADSAEGIRAFWLPPELRAAPLEHVIAALEDLRRDGVVEKRPVGAGFIYGAARATRH